MTTTTQTPVLSLHEQAKQLLPHTQIVYLGQSGEEFAFTVTHEGNPYTPVYHNRDRRWRCDCDHFDATQGECLHTELVKLWRQAQKESSNGAPPPPQTDGHRPPPPKAIAKEPEAEAPPAAPARRKAKKGAAPPSAFPTPASGVSGWTAEIAQALHAPFPAEMVGWKAQATTRDGSKAMAVAYIDARAVADRLDETVGPEHWCDHYVMLGEQRTANGPEIVVACRLTVLGVTKEDVGSGEDYKSAYSDAFKRAGVRHGIGRYLYSLDKQWVDFDAQKKQLKQTPQLPPWAVPS
jgi:hypothetical protein